MKQLNKNKEQEVVTTSKVDATIKEVFEETKSQPTTRVVTLLYHSGCGCGGSTTEVKRTVPYNSKLKDGDYISRIEKNDTIVR